MRGQDKIILVMRLAYWGNSASPWTLMTTEMTDEATLLLADPAVYNRSVGRFTAYCWILCVYLSAEYIAIL